MSTFEWVDPQLQPLLKDYVALNLQGIGLASLREQSKAAALAAMAQDDGLALTVSEQFIPGEEGGESVRVLVIAPRETTRNRMGILHLHGGGYIFGSPEGSLALTRPTAARQDCVIVSVDYRLAPESPFPAALNDSYAALVWMSQHAEALGVDPQNIGVMGDSAGAGLATGLALFSRDNCGPKIAFQNLMFPMLDDRTVVNNDPNSFAGEFIWTRESNAIGWASYLGQQTEPGAEGVSCYAAPARAEELKGLPPTWLGVGTIDLFVDECLEYSRRLIRAGVNVELNVYPGAFHGFNGSSNAEVAVRARESRQNWLSRFKPH